MKKYNIKIQESYKKAFWNVAKAIYPDFQVNEQNVKTIEKLLLYFTRNPDFNCVKYNQKYSLNKGILLIGNPGSGKSALMRIFQILVRNVPSKFQSTSLRNIAKIYESQGDILMRPKVNMLYEDLNVVNPSSFFGNQKNIPEELVYKRYELYIYHGTVSHFTTNESLDSLADKYGLYIKDRLLEMCNIFKLGATEDYHSYRATAEKPTNFDPKMYANFPTFFPTEYTEEEKQEIYEQQKIAKTYENLKQKAEAERKLNGEESKKNDKSYEEFKQAWLRRIKAQ